MTFRIKFPVAFTVSRDFDEKMRQKEKTKAFLDMHDEGVGT